MDLSLHRNSYVNLPTTTGYRADMVGPAFSHRKTRMRKNVMKKCTHCQGSLGLGVVRAFFRLFCSVRCRDAYRAALFQRAKEQLVPLGLPK